MAADYVIVGAGSAGCVLAARLSEDPDVQRAPARGGRPGHRARDPHPGGVPGRLQVEPRLGSARRAGAGPRRPPPLPAARPRDRRLELDQRDDLPPRQPRRLRRLGRRRAATAGATTTCCPYFKRSEDNERGEDAYHGVGGPLARRPTAARCSRWSTTMLEAAVQAGYELNRDLNGERQDGVGRFQLTQRDGLRWSAADAFLHPAAERPNLEVRDRALRPADRLRGRPRGRRRGRPRRRARDDARRARGDPLGRHLPVAGAADALRDRPGGGARPVRDRGARGPAGRPQPAGPLHGAAQLPDRRADAVRHLHARELRAARERGPRPAHLEHPRGRRLLPHAAGPARRRTSSSTSRRRCSTTRASRRRTTAATASAPS